MKRFLTSLLLAAAWMTFSVYSANSDQSLKAVFKNVPAVTLHSVKPVVKDNAIYYGERKVSINEDSSIECTQPEGLLFRLGHYYVIKKNNKYVTSFSPEDKRKKRIVMEPVRFENNVFIQKGKYSWEGKTGEFLQTVKILQDGRLELANQLSLPADLRADVYEDGFFFNFSSQDTFGKQIHILGPGDRKQILNVSFKANHMEASDWRFLPTRFIIGKGTAKEVVFSPNPANTWQWSIYNYVNRTALRTFARRGQKNRNCYSSVIVDLTKVPEWKDTRPDFMKLENIRLFDDKQTKNLLPDPSFEQGVGGHARVIFPGFDFSKKKWECNAFSVDPNVGYDGTSSLRFNTFSKTNWLQEAGCATLLPVIVRPGNYVFSCYVKGNRKGQRLNVWIGRTSLPIEKDRPPHLRGDRWMSLAGSVKKVTAEWTRMEFPVKVVIDQPVCININATSPSGDGSVWVDCVQFEAGTKATPWQGRLVESILKTEKEDNFLEYGKKHDLSLTVTSKVSGRAETKVVDFYDNVVWSKKYDLKQGKTTIKLDFNPDRGIYVVKTDYTFANGKKSWEAHRFSVMNFLNNTHKHKNLYGLDYGPTFMRPDIHKLLNRAQKVGFGSKNWIHCYTKDAYDLLKQYNMEFSHGALRMRDGKYGHSYNSIYATSPCNSRRTNWKEVPLCRDWREEMGENADVTDEYLKRLKAAVKVRVKNYPWIRRWSFGGEDDAADPTFAGLLAPEKNFRNYVKVHLAAMEAAREADPALDLIGGQIPCNSNPTGVPAIERFLKTAQEINPKFRYNSFAIHTYRYRPETPDMDLDVTHLRAVMKKYGYGDNVPIYFTEGGQYNLYRVPAWKLEIASWDAIHAWLYGAASCEMGWTEKMVAGIYARHYLTLLKHPNSSYACIAALAGHVFEMDLAMTPFATQKAVNTLGHLLGNADFVKDIRFASYVRCYVFEDELKRPVAAVWTYDPEIENGTSDAMVAAIPFGKEKIEIFDLMEASRKAVYMKDGKLRLSVSAQPMFIRGQRGRTAAFVKALSAARIISGGGALPVDLQLQITEKSAKLHVKNPADTAYKGTVTYNGKTMPLNVSGNAASVLDLPFSKPLSDRTMTKQKVELSLGKFEMDRSFEGILCHKTGTRPDWNKLPVIPFTRRTGRYHNADLSGSWQMAWNSQFFFLRVLIQDEKFVHEEYKDPAKRWNNDSLQVYFDTFCNARSKKPNAYDLDDYDYAVYPNKEGTKARLWRLHQPDIQLTLGTRTPPSYTFADDVKTIFTKVQGGYIYEIAFPVKYLLPIQLKKGYFFGFGLFVNDRDNDAHANGFLTLATDGKGCYNRPKHWPLVLLAE